VPTSRRALLTATGPLVLLPALAACSSGSSDDASNSDASGSDTGGQEPPSDVDLPDGWTWVEGTDAPTVSSTQDLPVTVTDGTGAKVEIKDTSKIIVGGDDVADMLAALGLQKTVYAAPEESTAQAAIDAPEHYAFNKSTGVEGLLAVKGTLFIGNNTSRHGDIAEKFRKAGVDAVVLDDQASIPDKIRAVASYVGAESAGEQLAGKIEDQLKAATSKAEENDLAEITVLVVTASGAGGANAVVGTGTAAAEITEALGVKDVGVDAGLRQYSVDYSDEALLKAAPDVILTGSGDLEAWKGVEGFLEAFPTLADTPAGQNSSILLMPGEQIKVSGTQVGAAAIALADALTSVTPAN
jgi:iron complex transport system substrate-binding protein